MEWSKVLYQLAQREWGFVEVKYGLEEQMGKVIMNSTHTDLHGHRFTKAALEDAAERINKYPLRKMVEHDYTLPPFGKVVAAEVVPYEDGEFVLVGLEQLYEEDRTIEIEGVQYLELVTPTDSRPFATRWEDKDRNEVSVSIDPLGIPDIDALRSWAQDLDAVLPSKKEIHLRKSLVPDPELIINLGSLIWNLTPELVAYYFLYKTGRKAADTASESIGEDIGNEIINLYTFLKVAPTRFVRSVVGRDRPTTCISVLPGDPEVTFVVKSNDPAVFEAAADLAAIASCAERAQRLKTTMGAKEVHFIYNENQSWFLNYFLTDTGATVGAKASVAMRDKVLKKILDAHTVLQPPEEANEP